MNAKAKSLADAYKDGADSHHIFTPLRSAPKLDAETFGKLIVFAWAAKNGQSDLPDRDSLVQELLENRDSLSDEGKDVLHAKPRAIGEPTIAEFSEYMAASQDAGLIKRFNPAYIRCHVEIGKIEAEDRLVDYKHAHGDLIGWLTDRMDALSQG